MVEVVATEYALEINRDAFFLQIVLTFPTRDFLQHRQADIRPVTMIKHASNCNSEILHLGKENR